MIASSLLTPVLFYKKNKINHIFYRRTNFSIIRDDLVKTTAKGRSRVNGNGAVDVRPRTSGNREDDLTKGEVRGGGECYLTKTTVGERYRTSGRWDEGGKVSCKGTSLG